MRVKLTCWLASVAAAAMKPASRPINFTRPIPFGAPLASTWAMSITSCAFSMAVEKPKERFTSGKSLSIVLGMPTTATASPRRRASAAISAGAPLRAVAAHAEKELNVRPLKEIDHHRRVFRPAAGAEHRSALLMDMIDHSKGQPNRRLGLGRIKSLIAVANAPDLRHAVVEVQFDIDRTDDVVQSRTETAAGDDRRFRSARVEEDVLSGPSLFHQEVFSRRVIWKPLDVQEDTGGVADETAFVSQGVRSQRQRRTNSPRAQVGHDEVVGRDGCDMRGPPRFS